MHNKFLFLIFAFLFVNTFSQNPIYIDEFESSTSNTINPQTGFTTSIINGALHIQGNGKGGEWSSIRYNFHLNGSHRNINVSSNPKLFIKVKSSPKLKLRADFRDQVGYVTNQSPISIHIDNNYSIYEFDFKDKFIDGGFGGPCTKAPCAVDATKIKGISFFVNPGEGSYSGKIEIEWISIGAILTDEQIETSNINIRYNQLGYLLGRDKIISITSSNNFLPLEYTIKNAEGIVVKKGITAQSKFWTDAQEFVTNIDFSEINTQGKYTINIAGKEQQIIIGNNIYDDLSLASLKYFYYNRASIPITSKYGGIWSRASGLSDTTVRIHSSATSSSRPTGTIISAPKGWFDAGDYNKYIVNSGISTYTLLAAFEHFSTYYQSKKLNIPESNNSLPDILDEVIWNLDWMLAMQDPNDGGVYHKLTGLNFSGRIMPHQYTSTRYVVKKSTAAALNFAAVTALASRIFENYKNQKPGYSETLKEASKKAYSWAKANPAIYFTNPAGVKTGEYGDWNVADEFQWAAIELFITTGETQFKNDININTINNDVPSWQSVASLGLFSINFHASALLNKLDVVEAKFKLLATADEIKNKVNNSAMKIGMAGNNYVWGSNGVASNQMMCLIRAYEVSKDESYLQAAYKGIDYVLGRNGTGYSFVSGFGDRTPMDPHHRISFADGISTPIPGMIAGGPQPGQQDGCATYPSNFAAKSFSDTWCSYSTNEVTINWNAPLAYVINALRIYQNENIALSVKENKNTLSQLQVYPNPVENLLHISISDSNIEEVKIYTISGKQIFKNNVVSKKHTIHFNNYKAGVYFVKIKTVNNIIIKKILKK